MTKEWIKGCNAGQDIVLKFLEEMKGLDLREEFEGWANADEYTKKDGEVVKRFA